MAPAAQSLAALRSSLSPGAGELLTDIWRHYATKQEWPASRPLYSKTGKAKVLELWRGLNGSIVCEMDQSGLSRYELGIVGVLLTEEGPVYERQLLAYLDYLRSVFKETPEKEFITDAELATALKLDAQQTKLLCTLIQAGSFYSRFASSGPAESKFGVLIEAEDFPPTGNLQAHLEKLVFRTYDPAAPVLARDRLKSRMMILVDAPTVDNGHGSFSSPASNPLKRCYQVFVSSTYSDLRDERQHAIQALLESKCIPSGMELFPAASTSQWDLIQRVIDDCDYYIVIIAGRYGSLTPDGSISYTEREFDYAVSAGKPIFAFCHEDIDLLQGAKLEKSDLGRTRLENFRTKAMQRMCRFWRTPEALASAIKSAIFNAIEHQPQPGWVRATSILAEQDTVAKLQQRISELKRTLDKKRDSPATRLATPTTLLTIPVEGHYYTAKDPNARYAINRKPVTRTFDKSWDEIFKVLGTRLEISTSFASLKKTLESRLAGELTTDLQASNSDGVYGTSCAIKSDLFDTVLRTLHSRGFITQRPCPRDTHVKRPYWIMTPTGAKYFAQLQAIT
jgi:hypothetical protein